MCFHHAVRAAEADLEAAQGRLQTLTANGAHAYYTDIADFTAGLPLPAEPSPRAGGSTAKGPSVPAGRHSRPRDGTAPEAGGAVVRR